MSGQQPPTKLWPQQPAAIGQLPRSPRPQTAQTFTPGLAAAQPLASEGAPTRPLPQGYIPPRPFNPQWQQAPAQWPPSPGSPGRQSGTTGRVAPKARARRRGVPLPATLALVLLLVGGGAWAVITGHLPGHSPDPGAASSAGPLPTPGLSAPGLPAPSLNAPGLPVPGSIGGPAAGGAFCQAAAGAVSSQSAALNDPDTDLATMARTGKASNHKMAEAAPPQLGGDFQEFLSVSDQLADTMSGGQRMRPETMLALASPRFGQAVDHITDYLRTSCAVDFTSLASPGSGR